MALHGVDGKLAAELALSSRFLALVAIWLLGLLAFWHALDGPWLLDDVRLRDAIAALGSQGLGALAGGGWQTHLFLGESGIGRPLAMASFGLNALVSDEIFGFKLVNLLLHLVNGTLVYSLARLLFSVRARASAPVPELAVAAAALVAALVWTVHPLQVSTVAYVVQRTTLLSALFSLWAMLLYARLRLRELAGAPAVGPLAWALPLLILPSLAVLANENGVLIPFFLLALELALFRLSGPVRTRRLLAVYFALALVLAGALALRLLLVPEAMAPGFSGLLFGPGERLLTEARVVAGYVGQVFVPRLGDLAFYYDGIVHSRGWLEPPTTLLSALFLLALAGLGLALLRRRPVAAFGTLLFFAGHATESTFLPLELAFEHRNYLPSLGLILAAVDLIAGAGGAVGRLSPVIGASAVAAVFGICLLRAVSWGSAEQIELTGIAANPPSQRARAGLAQLLIEQGRLDGARSMLAEARGPGPRLQEAYLDCLETGRTDAGRIEAAHKELGRQVTDYDATALLLMADRALDSACSIPRAPLLALVEAAARTPAVHVTSRQKLWLYVGHLRYATGDEAGALNALEDAFRVLPANPVPLLLAAHWKLDAGDVQGTRDLLARARAAPLPPRFDLSERFGELEARLDGKGVSVGE